MIRPTVTRRRRVTLSTPVNNPTLHRPISPLLHRRPRRLISAAAMSSSSVEHVVLFNVRPTADPSPMISSLLALSSLNLTSHLSVTPILRSPTSAPFTHLLHARYASKSDLAAYSVHPAHVAAVHSHGLPIFDDIMALDWLSDASGPPPGPAVRLNLAKLKEGVSAGEVLAAVAGTVPEGVLQVSQGENFSPARAKGYGVAFLSVFPGLEELDAVGGAAEVEAVKEKVRPLLESVIVVDYLIPAAAASL